tara:strand:- start:1030 stop:1269 length:240 start_codon:yes stop_codon:yes gene_type:complete
LEIGVAHIVKPDSADPIDLISVVKKITPSDRIENNVEITYRTPRQPPQVSRAIAVQLSDILAQRYQGNKIRNAQIKFIT